MKIFPYPMLTPPPFRWHRDEAIAEPKVHEWIRPLHLDGSSPFENKGIDIAILGAPLSRSSISASAASETPDAFRRAWRSFTPYNLEEDVDLTPLRVADLGDVRQHVTDIAQCHTHIRNAMTALRHHLPQTLPITIGGDHSITAMLIKGWKEAHPTEQVGLLQLDTHYDLRPLEEFGAANGTPVRNLIESGTLKGSNVWNIGLHGYFNSRSLKHYADQVGVNGITLKETRKKGIAATIRHALSHLDKEVDTIYLTLDMDVLDLSNGPGTPAGMPGGLRTDELLEAMLIAGAHPKVKAMDIVCLDPRKDIGSITVFTAVNAMLNFMVGVIKRGEA
ncbi:agmatinase family protein [Marininema halotolerans]|uniref:Formiminoglutamase n=1 Tax=Marininema halotolerans TaxID=1155944 RepID=A0A1I6QMN1_9BACL|nr:agmatinase family protein [Marininema halotolerans]SFS53711.1 formiminoglutamase [Marininema halotolerans]